ncbi:MAG: DUF4861 family protein, partial [Bacteroidales bacterium]|nr:DUF4861 family protein [Bacteroidales bacterium]
MKRTLIILAAVAALFCSSCQAPSEKKVMARYVPERMDDFVWENNLVCYRAYGEALEGNPTSPGFDIWVKLPGRLVADEWYKGALEDESYYHHDHGGKDCYKVAVSLGGGASTPLVDSTLVFPATNYRSYELISESDTEISFMLNYPAWDVNGVQVSLSKKITVTADSYFCKVEDVYSGEFETLQIAAGIFTHEVEESMVGGDRLAVWEHASDQSVEPEDGMLGVAVYVPGAESVFPLESGKPHIVATRTVKPGETFTYYFGSCWSKGDIKDAATWFEQVKAL